MVAPVIVSVAEAARIRARIVDLARLGRAGPGDRRPSAEELDDWCAEARRRWVRAHRPPVLSPLTGRPTPELPEAFHRLGRLPADPLEAIAECRRCRGLPTRAT